MSEAKREMIEARTQLFDLLRSGGIALVLLLALLAFVPPLFFGAVAGSLYGLLNIVLLFFLLAPYFFRREKPAYVVYGFIISLCVGACLVYFAKLMGQWWAVGFAFGLASPAFAGVVYALQHRRRR